MLQESTQDMDLAKILAELRRELANFDAAILSLERLQAGGRKRGRPPRWLTDLRKNNGAQQPPKKDG